MGYDYQKERAWVFTDAGQKQFLSIRDRVNGALKAWGALTIEAAIRGETGSTWEMLACVDRLVDLGEIRLVANPVSTFSQSRVIVKATL